MFLQKDDVTLRAVEKEDAGFLKECMEHPDVVYQLGRPPMPKSVGEEEEWIEELHEDDSKIAFMIEQNGDTVGEISLNDINREYRKARFGFMIHPHFHGQGAGTKSLELILEYAFDYLNLHRVEGGFVEGNEASKKVQERCGLTEEGRERDGKYVHGEYRDIVIYSILEHEWREHNS